MKLQKKIFLLALCALALGAFVSITVYQSKHDQLSDLDKALPADLPQINRPANSFTLVNQYGDETSLKDFIGKPVFLSFAFAHCHTICPTIVKQVRKAATDSGTIDPVVLFITLDPWRDTPEKLPTLAKQWELGENQYALSGPVESVLKILEDYNMPIERNEDTGEVVHPALVYLIDSDGHIRYTLNNPSIALIASAAEKIKAH